MTYKVLAFALCEAGVMDIRGQSSLIGIMPSRIGLPELPAQLAPTLCCVLEQDDPGSQPDGAGQIDFTVQAVDPDDEIAFFARQAAPVNVQDPEDPHRIQAVVQVPINFTRAGTYRFSLRIRVPMVGAAPETVELEQDLVVFSP